MKTFKTGHGHINVQVSSVSSHIERPGELSKMVGFVALTATTEVRPDISDEPGIWIDKSWIGMDKNIINDVLTEIFASIRGLK